MTLTRPITELEGAILSEIHHRGQKTAFQVRRAFAASFSLEWKGSAGAVYPAVKRLEKEGFIQVGEAQGGRAARHLSLTEAGIGALMAWAGAPHLSASPGVDPFRLRSGIWDLMAEEDRKKLFERLDAEIAGYVAEMEAFLPQTDPIERRRVELCIEGQKLRRRLLQNW